MYSQTLHSSAQEDVYNAEQKKGNARVIRTGVRYVSDLFLFESTMDYEDDLHNYINHSFTPSCLYHCGILFATENLAAKTEITVDYRFFLSEKDEHPFIDTETNRLVQGYSGKQALKLSTKALLDLLE